MISWKHGVNPQKIQYLSLLARAGFLDGLLKKLWTLNFCSPV